MSKENVIDIDKYWQEFRKELIQSMEKEHNEKFENIPLGEKILATCEVVYQMGFIEGMGAMKTKYLEQLKKLQDNE